MCTSRFKDATGPWRAPGAPQDELLELQEREDAAAVEGAAASERAAHDALMEEANLAGIEVRRLQQAFADPAAAGNCRPCAGSG